MLTHQPPIGAFDLGLIRLGADAQQFVGLFQGGTLGFGLTPASSRATGSSPAPSPALSVFPAHPRQVLQAAEDEFRDAQLLTDALQDALLGGGGQAIGVGGLDLDLDEHLQQGGAAVALPSELRQDPVQIEVIRLALIEQGNGGGAGLRGEIHAPDHRFRQGDLLGRHPAIGLGHMAEDGEGGGEEGGLYPLAVTGFDLGILRLEGRQSLVELMPDHAPKECPYGPSQHKAQGPADDLTPPCHVPDSAP